MQHTPNEKPPAMNNRFFLPRLHVLAMLLVFAVLASILNLWLDHSVLAFELAAAGDASASQRAASVGVSLKLSFSSPEFAVWSLQ